MIDPLIVQKYVTRIEEAFEHKDDFTDGDFYGVLAAIVMNIIIDKQAVQTQ